MMSETTVEYVIGNARDKLLIDAERRVLRRIVGVMANVQAQLHYRTACLSREAGIDQTNLSEVFDAGEREAARMITHMAHTSLGQYPAEWDDAALGEGHPFDAEQLTHDLRVRVRRAIAMAWNGGE
jgi:hypothetical protein